MLGFSRSAGPENFDGPVDDGRSVGLVDLKNSKTLEVPECPDRSMIGERSVGAKREAPKNSLGSESPVSPKGP